MSKELPYFRFTAQEWQNGDISFHTFAVKGLFIDICAMYWVRDCSITRAMLDVRYEFARDLLDALFISGILKENEETGNIDISFLNEQLDLLSDKRLRRIESGRAGGLKKASNAKSLLEKKASTDKDLLQQKASYKDKDKDKDNDNIVVKPQPKEKTFKQWDLAEFEKATIIANDGKLDATEFNAFIEYWTEPSASGKMRFHLQQCFDVSRRIGTWAKNNFNKGGSGGSNNGKPYDSTRGISSVLHTGRKARY